MRFRLENPVVTRTLRARLRGARAFLWPGIFLAILIAILTLIIVLLQQGLLKDAAKAFRFYFWTVVSIDLVTMVLVATVNTATSLAREKELLTLDFLRISGLGPAGIALGHLLGGLSIPLILAGVSAPLAVLAASIAAIPVRDVLTVAVLLLVYSLVASSFALAVGLFVKKSTTAGGWAGGPLIFLGFFGAGLVLQNSWEFTALAFISPGNFILPLIVGSSPFFPMGLVPVPLFGKPVDPLLFNMGILIFFSTILVVGVSRKLGRRSRSFLSPAQAFVAAAAILLLLGGLFDSAVGKTAGAFAPGFLPPGTRLYSDENLVTMFLSMALTIFVVFLVLATPTRERFLRERRVGAFLGGKARGVPPTRQRVLYTPALFVITIILLARILWHLRDDLARDLAVQGGFLIVFLLFYAAIVEEAKLCFGRRYIPWLGTGLSMAWVVLPMTGWGLSSFEVVRPYAWLLALGSPQTVLGGTLETSWWHDAFGGISLRLFAGISISLHVILLLLFFVHLSRLRKVILAEAVSASERLTGDGAP